MGTEAPEEDTENKQEEGSEALGRVWYSGGPRALESGKPGTHLDPTSV